MIQLHFFLAPFMAFGLVEIWRVVRKRIFRAVFILLITLQAGISFQSMLEIVPRIDEHMFLAIQRMAEYLPKDAMVITMDDRSGIMLRGWLPNHRIGAQGVFDLDWNYDQWQQFLAGPHPLRKDMLQELFTMNKGPLYIFASPFFFSFYKEDGKAFIEDPCFQRTSDPYLYKVACLEEHALTGA